MVGASLFSSGLLAGAERTDPKKWRLIVKISARNQLLGTIKDIHKGATTAHVEIEIGGGMVIMASITNEAVDELKLAKGQKAYAVIKASEVMVGVD